MKLAFLIDKAYAIETEFGEAKNLTEYINLIMPWILGIASSLAVLMMIYAGYIYMTSQGNPEATGRAKDIIIGVISGVLLLFIIEIILNQLGI